MSIVAIDPGTSNTGLVYMDERRIICCKTITYQNTVKADQDALKQRAENIARQIAEWIADKPHDLLVMEGFMGYTNKQGGYSYQTPYLCGYLHAALKDERIVIQTSRQVFNPRTRGNLAMIRDLMRTGAEPWAECSKCTNEHLRSAATHGIYYFKHKEAL